MLDDTFALAAYAAQDPSELVQALGERARVHLIEADEERPAVLYQDLASTRGVQVRWDSDLAQVRLRPFCSIEDQALAAQVLRLLRARHGSAITNGGEPVPDEDLAAHVRRVAEALADHVTRDLAQGFDAGLDQVWVFEGPVRPFFLGPQLWATLRAGSAAELGLRIVDRMRRVQYAHRDASVSLARRREEQPQDGAAFRVAMVRPESRWFVPSCELVEITERAGSQLLLPPPVLAALLGASCEALDERQLLLEAQRGPRREAFLRHARALAVDPAAFARGGVDVPACVARARLLGHDLALVEQGPAEPDGRAEARALSEQVQRLEGARKAGHLDEEGLGELETAYRELARAAFEAESFEDEAAALERRLQVVAAQVRSCGHHPTRLAAAHAEVAGAEERCGRPSDALHRLDMALGILASAPCDGSGVTANHLLCARVQRAELLIGLGREAEAASELEGALGSAPPEVRPQYVAKARLLQAGARSRSGADRLSVLGALEQAVQALRPAIERGEALDSYLEVVGELEERADDAGVLPLIAGAAAPALALLEAGRSPMSALLSLVVSRAKALWGSGDITRALAELERGCAAAAGQELESSAAWAADYALADLLRDRDDLDAARARIDDALGRAASDPEGEHVAPFLRINRLLTCLAAANLEGALHERELICRADGRARLGGLLWGSSALADAGRATEALAGLEEASALLGEADTMRGEGLRAELRVVRARARLAAGDVPGAREDAVAAISTFDAHLARGIHLGELQRLEALVVLGATGDEGGLERAVGDGERASDRLPRARDYANEAALWRAARGATTLSPPGLDRALSRPAGAARWLLALHRLASRKDGPDAEAVLDQALARLVHAGPSATAVVVARWRQLRPRVAGRCAPASLEALDQLLLPRPE